MKREKSIEDLIASGEIGTMTECAYGSAIADSEANNTLNKTTSEMTDDEAMNRVQTAIDNKDK